jgi:hypothetical protein
LHQEKETNETIKTVDCVVWHYIYLEMKTTARSEKSSILSTPQTMDIRNIIFL